MRPDWDAAGTGRLLRAAAATAANSRWTRACVAAAVPEAHAARVVYYGAPLVRLARPPAGLPARFALCAARQAEYKGQDLLLMALARLAAEGLELPLVLCGRDHSAGGLARFARRLGVARLVRDLGPRPHAEVQALMRRADFLVLPSRRDSLGGVLLESLAAGRPVVAARVGGIPELVRHGREGLLVPPKDPDALARALRRLWEDGALRRRLGAAARRRAGRFTWLGACRAYARLARARPGARMAVAVWEDGRDHTARTYLANAAAGLRALGYRPAARAWRGAAPDRRALEALAAARPEAWVVLLLRYRGVDLLTRFLAARGLKPVVHLC